MSAEYVDAALAQIRDTINRLQSPVPNYDSLLNLLSAPLDCLGLLPPQFVTYNVSPLPKDDFSIPRHIPALQRALLEHIIPAWEPEIIQQGSYAIVEQYFCPDAMSFTSPAAGQVAVHAYSTILSTNITKSSARLLVKLCKAYPIDVLYSALFSGQVARDSAKRTVTWEDCVRNAIALPAKVANALGPSGDIPEQLDYATYLNDLSIRCEQLINSLKASSSGNRVSSVTYLLGKLVNVGVFPSSRTLSPSQPSFFRATLPIIRNRLAVPDHSSYSESWANILSALPSLLMLQSIITSFSASLSDLSDPLDAGPRSRALIKREAQLLEGLLGTLRNDEGDLVDSVSAVILGREWNEAHARIYACWIAGVNKDQVDHEALNILLAKVADMWTSPEHIKHSLLSRHHYVTALLLFSLTSFGSSSHGQTAINSLAFSPPFITSISTYISHLDPAVRRCGMLVAEEVAKAAGKSLVFGDWEGDGQGREWCRRLRELIKARDTDADFDLLEEEMSLAAPEDVLDPGAEATPEPTLPTVQNAGYDSDDSLTGYASPTSSRSASPTPSELAEIEKDPSLNVGKKRIARPVYLAQLGEMLRSSGGLKSEQEEQEAEKIEVAINVAEELIRRKRGYGTELDENAVNLAYGLIGLHNNYDLDGFDQKRQGALTALVACCPRRSAPAIIEEFFKNQYSTDQRYVMLNALVLGTRELAGVPLQPSSVSAERPAFPSKRLPPALHSKYLTAGDTLSSNDPAQLLLQDISRLAIEKSKEETADKVPDIVRQRQLRIRKSAKISEVTPQKVAFGAQAAPKSATFTEVAAEYFICPLINRFWLFLRDEQTREARTAHQSALHRYHGAGTGLVLNAVVLARFLSALAVLVHTGRNAPEWLAVIAPDALELSVTLGTRPVSVAEGEDSDGEDTSAQNTEGSSEKARKGKEAAVLTNALELSLVVLDGCLELDQGRSLGLEHTALLLSAGEWAGTVMAQLDNGIRMLGGGGEQELRLQRAAAGVVLKVDELSSRWKRSMIDV